MRIGIFGGTFDPPHLGHLILAAEARYQLDLARLLWTLTAHPPHKQDRTITPLQHRLDMVNAALADEPAFELSRVEIDRPGPHYALDTVRLLQAQYPQAELFYLMGGDSLQSLPTWHRPQEFLDACHILGVMRRPGDTIGLTALESVLPGIGEKVQFVDTPLLEIASHQIRRRIAQRRPFRHYLPPSVHQIIHQRSLYQTPD